jgi:molybdopterin synthase catalytic subunit
VGTSRVTVQTHDFDLSAEVAALRAQDATVGAVVTFTGTVRDQNPRLHWLELEHYPGMTERAIEAMIDSAQQRFDIRAARVIHRVGRLQPLDQIVLVAVTASHRGLQGLRIFDGLSQDPGAILEESMQ